MKYNLRCDVHKAFQLYLQQKKISLSDYDTFTVNDLLQPSVYFFHVYFSI